MTINERQAQMRAYQEACKPKKCVPSGFIFLSTIPATVVNKYNLKKGQITPFTNLRLM